jgi:hypothetical protein
MIIPILTGRKAVVTQTRVLGSVPEYGATAKKELGLVN